MHVIPCLIGACLWAASTGLLLEEAWHVQRFDIATLSVPILTAATVASAVMAHHRGWRRPISALGFLLLALLGSTVMVTGTLGRIAEAKDAKQADVHRVNRDFGLKQGELEAAKAAQVKECRIIGKRCEAWNARVDALTVELSGITVRSTDPKAESIARLATLLGFDGNRVKEVVQAFDPVTLPLFLELGSVLFFAGAFPRKRIAGDTSSVANANNCTIIADARTQLFTREQALQDLRVLRQAGSGRHLAQRWGVDPATASRWLQSFEDEGAISRARNGKARAVLALPQQCPVSLPGPKSDQSPRTRQPSSCLPCGPGGGDKPRQY